MDPYLVTAFCVTSLIGVSCYQGWFGKLYKASQHRYSQAKLLLSLMSKLRTDGDQIASPQLAPAFTINDNDISASIVYERLGQQYTVTLPFSRRYIVSMSQFKAELLCKDGSVRDITQQPGMPYIISAADLNGDCIRVTNQETGKHHDYSVNQCPMYAVEAMDNE